MANWFARPMVKAGGGFQSAANNAAPIYGPQATAAIIDGSDVAAGTAHVGKLQAQANFKDNASALYTAGIMVTVYDAAGYATGNAAAIAAATMDVSGNVAIDVPPQTGDVVLVCDPLAANIGAELNMTKAVTPTAV